MEVVERHNGSVMDEGLTRPQMGHATSGTRMLRLESCAFSTLEGADGHKLVLPGTPRRCVGTSAGLLRLVAFAFSIPYGGPVAANDHRFRIAREEDTSVRASMCSFLNERIFLIFTFYFATPHRVWDLSFPTRDRICAPCSGSAES